MSLIVDEHRRYIDDVHRIGAFDRALSLAVKPGSVVLDLASGTGILGLLACKHGAGRVYAIDTGGIVQLARVVATANSMSDRVVYLREFSKHAELPEKVDIVVSDQIGRFGFEAGVWDYSDDARRRFLKPEGQILPQTIDIFVAAVESRESFDAIEFWKARRYGLDFSPAWRWAVNTGYPIKLTGADLISEASQVASLDVAHCPPAPIAGVADLRISRDSTLHGIGGWFRAILFGSVELTNSPLSSSAIDRRNVFFPLAEPVHVEKGDNVHVSIKALPREVIVSWSLRVERGGRCISESSQSTWDGMLLSEEDLRRTDPSSIPRLTPRGEARRTVLEMCDGMRPLREIEESVFARHRSLFESASEAAAFVAEVVIRYSA